MQPYVCHYLDYLVELLIACFLLCGILYNTSIVRIWSPIKLNLNDYRLHREFSCEKSITQKMTNKDYTLLLATAFPLTFRSTRRWEKGLLNQVFGYILKEFVCVFHTAPSSVTVTVSLVSLALLFITTLRYIVYRYLIMYRYAPVCTGIVVYTHED